MKYETEDERGDASYLEKRGNMVGNLSGKTALITGAGQGAGMGAALALAAEDSAVVLLGRTLSKVENIAAQIRQRGGRAQAFGGDVTVAADREAAVAFTLSQFGSLDTLVQAAQSPQLRTAPILDVENEVLMDLWTSGAMATLAFMKLVHPIMARAGGGSIINFGSGTEFNPAQYGAYAAVKAAIRTISRAAAVEWGPDNIRVNVVVPFVDSPANDLDPHDLVESAKRVPLRRVGDPESDIGRPIAFLAGDGARYVTGSTLMLDGGVSFLG